MTRAPTTSTGHRRSERKAQTRQTLIDTALRLIAKDGFDAITTDDIAAAAGVSPRTFFRYFPTKESVLLYGEDHFISSFTGVYLAQPEQAEIDAIVAAFVALAPGISHLHGRIRLYHKALTTSYVLRGQEQAYHEENVARVASAIARRRGRSRPDTSCSLLAAVCMTTLQTATSEWAAGPARVDLRKVIENHFALLLQLVAPSR
ncbi:MAG TPA: TetR family transcriptional regulator [Mycobacteriales bacterium]|nr:TetR family transcriptional regulator [Mycobacteriales bacterium]